MSAGPAAVETGFPVTRCARCGREVLTHLDVDAARRCVRCDAEVDPGTLRWISAAELGPLGYALEGERGGGCGSGGCGGGGGCARR